ncbi:MAG: tRNA (N6-isopentenyl adenosine(37)-C2)-methylthiotransferase MiaB [Clostridiales bacterium]|nr:tRNA (N6-isopentenyl adenosine(37)-C2)-methylthiotransferase MiaB [Clostridiales bacterium]
MGNTYRIITYGCQMNIHESEKIAGLLENAGYTEANESDPAAVVVLNTCCVRESAETHVLGNLGALKKQWEKYGTKIIVCGCMTQANGTAQKLKERCPFLFAVLGTHNIERIPALLLENSKKTLVEIKEEGVMHEGTPVKRAKDVNAWVNIMYGCNNFCTYCIVPYVRGRERSREKEHILAEIKNLIASGYTQITLLGQNVNSYDIDLHGKPMFASLLSQIADLDGTFRIKFMTSHPKDLDKDVVSVIAQSEKLSKFIHLPAQSGSDRVLHLMNRKYTRAEYLKKIDMIREKIPNAGLSADLMVGFPTESEEDFQDTLSLADTVRYNNLYTFIYSPRSGTPAATMDGQIPLADKKRRIQELIDLQFEIGNALAAESVGKTYTVLAAESKNGHILGETECGKAVTFDGDASLIGKFVRVKITQSKNSKLFGEVL